MTREELVQLVTRIMNVDYSSEAEGDALVAQFNSSTPHPAASDLIFYSKEELTPEQIVDRALAYRPVEL